MNIENRKREITVEEFETLDVRVRALLWQNLLKRLGNGVPEPEAKKILLREIRKELELQANYSNVSLLDHDPEPSAHELLNFLFGQQRPKESYLAEEILTVLMEVVDEVMDVNSKPLRIGYEVEYASSTCHYTAEVTGFSEGYVRIRRLGSNHTDTVSGESLYFLNEGKPKKLPTPDAKIILEE